MLFGSFTSSCPIEIESYGTSPHTWNAEYCTGEFGTDFCTVWFNVPPLQVGLLFRIDDVQWDGDSILVMSAVVVSPPYKTDNVDVCIGEDQRQQAKNSVTRAQAQNTADHLKKIVSQFIGILLGLIRAVRFGLALSSRLLRSRVIRIAWMGIGYWV